MTRDRVDEERADPGALGAARGGEQIDEDVASAELAIGEPEMGEAGRFGLAAALGQPLGMDTEAEDLLSVRQQCAGQLLAIEVFRDQRIVGCPQAMLHRQVDRGRRLAAAAHAHQDHVG